MTYRTADEERAAIQRSEDEARSRDPVVRVPFLLREIQRLDQLIGEAASQAPHGVKAPPFVVAWMEAKETYEAELRELSKRLVP
ncbi:MAG: hypothetical protein JST00_08180 [Deltaproteobacteria bacterium]|nr:hypothetical protein [Deltaproteobacteria bacterium]